MEHKYLIYDYELKEKCKLKCKYEYGIMNVLKIPLEWIFKYNSSWYARDWVYWYEVSEQGTFDKCLLWPSLWEKVTGHWKHTVVRYT